MSLENVPKILDLRLWIHVDDSGLLSTHAENPSKLHRKYANYPDFATIPSNIDVIITTFPNTTNPIGPIVIGG